MRRLFLVTVLISFASLIYAQDKGLIALGSAPDIYISHTVAAKENYYSIGRLYNLSPKVIAPFNKLEFEKPLSPGQVVKIPLVNSNFAQTSTTGKGEVAIPIYHTVEPKEGLYRISLRFNKVPLDVLKKWNNLNSDAVSAGTRLVVGYLKVLEDQSALAKNSSQQNNSVTTTIAKTDDIPVTGTDTKETEKAATDKPKAADKPATEKPKVAEKPAEKEKPKPAQDKPAVEDKQTSVTETSSKPPAINHNGGIFKKSYDAQADDKSLKTEAGQAGVFKSTSGWQDGKYYCLHNTAKPETIIKVTNEATGKTIYAKVLDMIPDIKQNTGAVILISNAAAEELGAGETKFNVNLTYTKNN